MAKKVTINLVDDLDGTQAESTRQFSIDGINYEIDLSKKNSDKLEKILEIYVSNGRRVGGRKRGKTIIKSSRDESKAIREWAKAEGIEVSSRGRIPADVAVRYRSAAGLVTA